MDLLIYSGENIQSEFLLFFSFLLILLIWIIVVKNGLNFNVNLVFDGLNFNRNLYDSISEKLSHRFFLLNLLF